MLRDTFNAVVPLRPRMMVRLAAATEAVLVSRVEPPASHGTLTVEAVGSDARRELRVRRHDDVDIRVERLVEWDDPASPGVLNPADRPPPLGATNEDR